MCGVVTITYIYMIYVWGYIVLVTLYVNHVTVYMKCQSIDMILVHGHSLTMVNMVLVDPYIAWVHVHPLLTGSLQGANPHGSGCMILVPPSWFMIASTRIV